jgi:hypothetical protein
MTCYAFPLTAFASPSNGDASEDLPPPTNLEHGLFQIVGSVGNNHRLLPI